MIAQLFHIEIELVLPEDSTKERTQTMRYQILTLRQRELLDHEIMPTKKVAEGGYDAQSVCK
jgi:cysteine synthase B